MTKQLEIILHDRLNKTKPVIMKNICLLYLFLLAGLAGCVSTETVVSDHVNPADIYQSYAVFGNKKETNLYAFFRVGGSGGTTVELVEPSKVKYNGSLLTKIAPNFLKGTSYGTAEEGYHPAQEIFFTNAANKDYRYNLNLEALEFNVKEPLVLRRSQTNYIPLNRIPPDSGEKVELVLSNEEFQKQEKNRVSVDLPKTFDQSKKALIITPEVLQKFPAGMVTVVMTTAKSLSITREGQTAGGDFTVNYSAAPLKIRIAN